MCVAAGIPTGGEYYASVGREYDAGVGMSMRLVYPVVSLMLVWGVRMASGLVGSDEHALGHQLWPKFHLPALRGHGSYG